MHPGRIIDRAGWALLAAIGIGVIAVAAGVVRAGALDPAGPPAPAMKTLAQLEPRTPISSIPFAIVQPGSYYVTGDLTNASGAVNGITIAADNVTLDLSGFTLDGAGTGLKGVATTPGRLGVTIRNGSATRWATAGFSTLGAKSVLIEDVEANANLALGISAINTTLRGCTASANGAAGISVFDSSIVGCTANRNATGIEASSSVVERCSVVDNSGPGVVAGYSTIRGCYTMSNQGAGISAARSVVEANVTGGDLNGINASYGSTVRNNTVTSSMSDGIYISAGGGALVADNAIKGAGQNGGSGIYAPTNGNRIYRNLVTGTHGPGIQVTGANNEIDENVSLQNMGTGILIGGSGNTIIRNRAIQNFANAVLSNYVVNGVNNLGPITTAASAANHMANTEQ